MFAMPLCQVVKVEMLQCGVQALTAPANAPLPNHQTTGRNDNPVFVVFGSYIA